MHTNASHSKILHQSRALMILESARNAGLTPLPVEVFHNIAYFSNILAPIFNCTALDGKVLKLKKGPYYPDLQTNLDWLVLCGFVDISNLKYLYIPEIKNWRIFADYEINTEKASNVLYQLKNWTDEKNTLDFIKKVTLALTELSNSEIATSNEVDATYADNSTDFGNVIDYGEWVEENPSTNAFELIQNHFSEFYISEESKLDFYVRHLSHKITNGSVIK